MAEQEKRTTVKRHVGTTLGLWGGGTGGLLKLVKQWEEM